MPEKMGKILQRYLIVILFAYVFPLQTLKPNSCRVSFLYLSYMKIPSYNFFEAVKKILKEI